MSGSAEVGRGQGSAAQPGRRPSGLVSRRSLLLLGAAATLAACESPSSQSASEQTPLPPHPDEAVRERAAQAERRLVALYVAAGTAHPDLEPDLARFADRHLRHITAIEATARPRRAGSPSPTRSPSPPAATPTPPEISADPEAAIQRLRDAEAAAVDERRADCLQAREQALATVLASIAGCEAAHERLLRRIG